LDLKCPQPLPVLAKEVSQIYEVSFPRVYFYSDFTLAYGRGACSIFIEAMATSLVSKADDPRAEKIFGKQVLKIKQNYHICKCERENISDGNSAPTFAH
jgi:hypothetical protein